MIQGSRFLDLRGTGRVWGFAARSLPDKIATPSGESLEGISLPNASLCADYLVGPSNLWAGVAVGVSKTDIPLVSELFQPTMGSLVQVIVPEQAAKVERYKKYPDWGWIEVLWSRVEGLELVEVQTDGVLWYELAGRVSGDGRIVVLGLEDLVHLVSEADRPLVLPNELVGT